jgi:quercetin dioxygenase-like cupin family protein
MDHVPRDSADAVEVVPGVHLSQLAAGESMSVQGFYIEPDAVVPEHSHHHEQAGYVAAGTLTFVIDGETYPVAAGDSYVVPGDVPHSAENRGDVPVEGVDVFSPPRTDPDWAED